MEKGVRKTKRCCIVELYNYREEMITTLVYEEEAGEALMKPLEYACGCTGTKNRQSNHGGHATGGLIHRKEHAYLIFASEISGISEATFFQSEF